MRDQLLSKLPGFDPDKSGEYEIPLNWIARSPKDQPRKKGTDPKHKNSISKSIAKHGQDEPLAGFLNPIKDSKKPIRLYGGNHRFEAMEEAGSKTCIVRYNHRVNEGNAKLYAIRHNSGKPLTLEDEVEVVCAEMNEALKIGSGKKPTNDDIERFAEELAPNFSKGKTWVIRRYVIGTRLHPHVLQRMFLDKTDPLFLDLRDGVSIAQISDKKIQAQIVAQMEGKDSGVAALILDTAIQKYCGPDAKRVAPSRITAGTSTIFEQAGQALTESVGHLKGSGSGRRSIRPSGIPGAVGTGNGSRSMSGSNGSDKPLSIEDSMAALLETGAKISKRIRQILNANPNLRAQLGPERLARMIDNATMMSEATSQLTLQLFGSNAVISS